MIYSLDPDDVIAYIVCIAYIGFYRLKWLIESKYNK